LAATRRWREFAAKHATAFRLLAGIALLAGGALALSGCGDVVVNKNAGTPNTYTVTVTAASGNVQKTTTVALTVQ